MNVVFRELRADEIDVRVGTVGQAGATLLLYKDARADMSILDEAVGPLMWKREHARDNANCIVSIFSKEINQWVSKEDTGTESNTEREKGQASDSFKRACTNWGIGRELHSAPFIHVKVDTVQNNGKWQLADRYSLTGIKVSSISYKDRKITDLELVDKNGKAIFKTGNPVELVSKADLDKIFALNLDPDMAKAKAVLSQFGYKSTRDIKKSDFNKVFEALQAIA